MLTNPWQVNSLQAFSCLKCPECAFSTKEETLFQDHAVENHVLSCVLFGKIKYHHLSSVLIESLQHNSGEAPDIIIVDKESKKDLNASSKRKATKVKMVCCGDWGTAVVVSHSEKK